ncbi:COBRA-like protein 7 [Hibiscus syriacus]|uniref:COBRA-like protein 7 n=1 Tax=Hibiscus syriacus TaxID=106335 RepID=A0A6A2YQH1_HIBSY|nr:COBRA-like protein 7 [Hibiscus syriacus]
MPPDLNRTELASPGNWKINCTMNPDYECGSPVRVSPSQFPDPSGLPSETAAVASWQVVCNMTQSMRAVPRCCVSYSAFFNDSSIPCNTCVCGCNRNPSQTCSASELTLLLRPDSLLIPFENRTAEALGFEDWFTAVQLDNAVPGFEAVYTFNGSVLQGSNNTIFMQGRPGLNYLLAETEGSNPRKDHLCSRNSIIGYLIQEEVYTRHSSGNPGWVSDQSVVQRRGVCTSHYTS